MKTLTNIIRFVPIGAMSIAYLGVAIGFIVGGFARVIAWIFGLQLVLPLFGLLALLCTSLLCLLARRVDKLARLSFVAALSGLSMLGFTLQAFPIEYPAGDGEPVAMVRPPMDGTIQVGWGGDTIDVNYHAAHPDQRWAYDLLIPPMFTGSENNADYGCWGTPVLAPIDAQVVLAKDGSPDATPGVMDMRGLCGNTIGLELATGTYLLLCHLQEDLILVQEGDTITRGQAIAKCGNSGHTSEPHLHIHHQRQDPRVFPFGFAEGLRLGFEEVDGPVFPNGGIEMDGEHASATGDTIRFAE